jgi:hypothetical protein
MARSRVTRVLLLALLLLPLILMVVRPVAGEERRPAGAAGAVAPGDAGHDGHAVVALEGRHPGDAGSVHYVVRVTWSEDGHPVEGSTVTAALLDAFGNALSTVTLDPVDADGRYAGTVAFPSEGLWTVRFTSSMPVGSLDAVEQLPLSVPVSLPDFSLIEFPATP